MDGLYNQQYKYPPETIISHSFYMRYPEEFYRFYKDRMLFTGALPNGAHKALARLEERGKLKAVITQNIDASTRWREAGKCWSFTAVYIGITVPGADSFMIWITL